MKAYQNEIKLRNQKAMNFIKNNNLESCVQELIYQIADAIAETDLSEESIDEIYKASKILTLFQLFFRILVHQLKNNNTNLTEADTSLIKENMRILIEYICDVIPLKVQKNLDDKEVPKNVRHWKMTKPINIEFGGNWGISDDIKATIVESTTQTKQTLIDSIQISLSEAETKALPSLSRAIEHQTVIEEIDKLSNVDKLKKIQETFENLKAKDRLTPNSLKSKLFGLFFNNAIPNETKQEISKLKSMYFDAFRAVVEEEQDAEVKRRVIGAAQRPNSIINYHIDFFIGETNTKMLMNRFLTHTA